MADIYIPTDKVAILRATLAGLGWPEHHADKVRLEIGKDSVTVKDLDGIPLLHCTREEMAAKSEDPEFMRRYHDEMATIIVERRESQLEGMLEGLAADLEKKPAGKFKVRR